MNIIFPSTIAKKHGISTETAARALRLSKLVTKKSLSPKVWALVIDDLRALSMLFCIDCQKLGDWHVVTKQCIDCSVWHCEKHIEKRRCQCCSELRVLR